MVLAVGILTLTSQYAAGASNVLDKEVAFNLPRQQVENALLGFSEQAQMQILTASTAIPDRFTEEVTGRMRVRAALESILRGTGLAFAAVNENTIAIQSANVSAGAAPPVRQLPPAAPVLIAAADPRELIAQSDARREAIQERQGRPTRRAEPEVLEEVVVTATKRGKETVQSLPLSISALSGEHLLEAGATVFSDWSHSVPGPGISRPGTGRQTLHHPRGAVAWATHGGCLSR